MLKLILMLTCDSCGDSFERASVSCDRDPKAWRYLADELGAGAQTIGWDLYDGASLCFECTEDMPCTIAE